MPMSIKLPKSASSPISPGPKCNHNVSANMPQIVAISFVVTVHPHLYNENLYKYVILELSVPSASCWYSDIDRILLHSTHHNHNLCILVFPIDINEAQACRIYLMSHRLPNVT